MIFESPYWIAELMELKGLGVVRSGILFLIYIFNKYFSSAPSSLPPTPPMLPITQMEGFFL